jgi:hypothetical protein
VVRRWMRGSTRTASARKDGLVLLGAPGERGPFRGTDGENGGRNDTDDLASLSRWGKGQPFGVLSGREPVAARWNAIEAVRDPARLHYGAGSRWAQLPRRTLTALPQHPDQHRSEHPILLTVDQKLGEGNGCRKHHGSIG